MQIQTTTVYVAMVKLAVSGRGVKTKPNMQNEDSKQRTILSLSQKSPPSVASLGPLTPLSLGRRHRVGVEHGRQQVLDHLVLVLLAGRLDLLDLGRRLAVRLLLGRLVALCVLGLELFELGLLGRLVLVNLLARLVARLSYALRADCSWLVRIRSACYAGLLG